MKKEGRNLENFYWGRRKRCVFDKERGKTDMFIKSSFMVIKKWNQPESVNRLVGKENVKYMYNGTLFCLGKKILSLFSVIYMDPYEHWVE